MQHANCNLQRKERCHYEDSYTLPSVLTENIMHGQKRAEYKARLANDAIAAKLSHKASQWNNLTSELLKRRDAMLDHGDENIIESSLQVTAKLLSVNPDPNYLWNYRREILDLQILAQKDSTHEEWLKQELIVTQTALEANPKAYGAWFHRKWCIRKFVHKVLELGTNSASSSCQTVLDRELYLCAEFLTLDERNFHCWNYRRFIVGCNMDLIIFAESSTECSTDNINDITSVHSYMNGAWTFTRYLSDNVWKESIPTIGAQLTPTIWKEANDGEITNVCLLSNDAQKKVYNLIQSEYQFTYDKIAQNFSNGSAFHYRTKLLPFILSFRLNFNEREISHIKFDLAREELDIIRNAIFTEPDDQTCWWYLRFIVDWSNPLKQKQNDPQSEEDDDYSVDEYKDMLYQEWLTIRELVEAEKGRCKWGLLAMHMIAMIFLDENVGLKDTHFKGEDWMNHVQTYVSQLQTLDPDRSIRYKSLLNLGRNH